jgi:uncharacterized protein (DUF952 family)
MIYHMVPVDFWDSLSGEEPYQSQSFAKENFIHTSGSPEQLLKTANRLYKADPAPFIIVCIDESKLDAELRWELAEDEHYPHIWGLLNREAVVDVIPFPRDADGTFLMPDALVEGSS